ncbi:MAG: ribosome maturation factor RimP, partial [Aquirufa sp.]
MDLTSKLKDWTLAYIGEGPLLLVDFSVSQGAKRTLITILVDTVEGVTIDQCALMSRKLAHFIEEGMLIEEAYNLEVSSPGVGEPLQLIRQYHKNIGRELSVKLENGEIKEGKLLAVDEHSVSLEEKVKEKGKKAQLI